MILSLNTDFEFSVNVFRAVNFELFVKPNKTVGTIGTAGFFLCLVFVGYIYFVRKTLANCHVISSWLSLTHAQYFSKKFKLFPSIFSTKYNADQAVEAGTHYVEYTAEGEARMGRTKGSRWDWIIYL